MKNVCYIALLTCLLSATGSIAQDIRQPLTYGKQDRRNTIAATANQALREGHYDSAIVMLQQVLNMRHNLAKTEPPPDIYYYLGSAYIFKGEYRKGISCLHQAAAIANKQSVAPSLLLTKIYNNLSIALNRIAENDKAMDYLNQAESIANTYKHIEIIPGILVNKGRIYKEMREWSKSKEQFNKALYLLDSLDNIDNITGLSVIETKQIIHTNTGQLFLQQNKPQQALSCFSQAHLLSPVKANPYNIIPNLLGLGKAHFALKNYILAERYLYEALDMAEKSKVADGITEAARDLSTLYATMKNYEKAYLFHKKYKNKEDEIRGLSEVKEIRSLETKYQIAEKDRQLAENKLQIVQQQKNIAKKNLWISGITIGSVMLFLSTFLIYRNLKHRQRNQQNQIQLLQQEKEIDQLKALMQGEEKERKRIAHELHDGIGGMLAAVKMNFAALKKRYEQHYNPEELAHLMHMLEDTSDEVRKTAHNLMPSILLKHNLSEALTTYCQHISNKGILNIQFYENQLSQDLPKDFELMIYRTAQELIQNIIKHAEATEAVIELEQRNGKINITVEDNGKGFNTEYIETEGFGLQNIKFKVQALQGDIRIESAPGKGSTISISFEGEHVLKSFHA